jgi:glycosyltransferase involved in cell wall biosynthesis
MSVVPAISILTPVWNGLPYIKETVESVLAQDFQDWEMIVGDNASNDGTSEFLQSLNDPRIKVYRHEKNLGVYRNIYFLFNKARAPLFVGLCADDYFYPGSLTKIMNEWKVAGPDVGLISFNWKKRQLKHDKLTTFSYEVLPKTFKGIDSTFAFFLFGNIPGNFSEVSGKTSLVAGQHYLYDIKFSADYEFWLRLTQKENIYLSTLQAIYIRRHDRVAATYAITKGEYHEESVGVYEKIIDELSKHCDRKTLIAFYNTQVCSYHLRDAIKSSFYGRLTALKLFFRLQSPIFWRMQFMRCLPYALSQELRYVVASRLATKILKKSKLLTSDKVENIEYISSAKLKPAHEQVRD